jgi:hypothetical protein
VGAVAALRGELSARAQAYAAAHNLRCCLSRGNPSAACFVADAELGVHGNFLPASYRLILKNSEWRRRLAKSHTLARDIFPSHPEYERWRELDTAASSDALLMNIFCFPRLLRNRRVLDLLGADAATMPEFGVKARVPLASGRFDRTELDMRLGDLLVEAKLTESQFQTRAKEVLHGYRDFNEVFDDRALPQTSQHYLSYQLIRNVLAAHATASRFCLLLDARRPDLLDAWYSVLSAVHLHELRHRCRVLTWQELATALPPKLQRFLGEKYGIINVPSPTVSAWQRAWLRPCRAGA